jgi:glucose-6-phosphate isomerase
LLGTRQALYENGRDSMTLTLGNVDARSVGVLIALYERAVGFYASLVGINAYHQPGVEAGKKAAAAVLDLEVRAVRALGESPEPLDAAEVAARAGAADVETVFHLLRHLADNPGTGVVEAGARPADKTGYLRAKFQKAATRG